jgi:glycosyltransferase involved in cell wall biosynthesis
MHVLYLTTELPFPAVSGGRVRTAADLTLLESLPEVRSVDLLCLEEEPSPPEALREVAEKLPKARLLGPIFHPIHLKKFPHYLPLVAALRVVPGYPYLAGKWASVAVAKAIVKACRARRPDVVYVDHLGMMVYERLLSRLVPGVRIVLGQHNVESDFFAQFAEKKRGVVRLVADLETTRARAFERDAMRRANAVVAISSSDRDAFEKLAGIRAHVVPQVVRFERTEWEPKASPRLVYVGNLSWHPNVAGLDWFVKEAWPEVRRLVPEVVLDVIGSGLPRDANGKEIVPKNWLAPGIVVHGFAKELAPHYANASVFLAPILGGSGVRIKLLEGFRAGLPLVTTTAGALGLPVVSGRELLVSDDPTELARHVATLLGDVALQRTLRQNAFDFLEREHGLAKAQGVLRDALGISPREATRTP